jgi:hypothetical protein
VVVRWRLCGGESGGVDSAGRVREGKQERRIGGGWGIVDGMVEDIREEEDNVEDKTRRGLGDVGPTCKKYGTCPMVSVCSLKSQTSCLKLLICCLKEKFNCNMSQQQYSHYARMLLYCPWMFRSGHRHPQ